MNAREVVAVGVPLFDEAAVKVVAVAGVEVVVEADVGLVFRMKQVYRTQQMLRVLQARLSRSIALPPPAKGHSAERVETPSFSTMDH